MLTVQTNDGLINADSYVSVDEFNEYVSKRGIDLTSDAEPLLIKAMDYIEARQYKSKPINDSQLTAFPRDGFGIPRAIKTAQMVLATIADTTYLMPNILPTDKTVVQEKVDVISVTYETAKTEGGLPVFSQVDALLKPYLASGGYGLNIPVRRG
ncbi:DnaT-like ssDNA-binding protein [Psychrobacter sp. I-STPA6b]|uniref:DnaT-like ssDNA-binding protein n=1 Tax=Psychrobacter sp. I-STPA6b TaxID=2585718 RepID=UPI001D0C974D|nr:DnaT-like ssDNA-binding protein [Psychrobacter sp. I-STPA6b]